MLGAILILILIFLLRSNGETSYVDSGTELEFVASSGELQPDRDLETTTEERADLSQASQQDLATEIAEINAEITSLNSRLIEISTDANELSPEEEAAIEELLPVGAQGIQGIQGPQGLQGERGATGVRGPAGEDGEDGQDSITETMVETGTMTMWPRSTGYAAATCDTSAGWKLLTGGCSLDNTNVGINIEIIQNTPNTLGTGWECRGSNDEFGQASAIEARAICYR